MEKDFDLALSGIRSGVDPATFSPQLSALVLTLAIRTRALRGQLLESSHLAIAEASGTVGHPVFHEMLVETLRPDFDEVLRDGIEEAAFPARVLTWVIRKVPFLRAKVFSVFEKQIRAGKADPGFRNLIERFAAELRGEDEVRRFHVNALTNVLEADLLRTAVPDAVWSIQPMENLVLGDTCVIGVNQGGELGNLLRYRESCASILLPISTSEILVAGAKTGPPPFTPEQINRASVALSCENFWAAEHSATFQDLASELGQKAKLISPKELARYFDRELRRKAAEIIPEE